MRCQLTSDWYYISYWEWAYLGLSNGPKRVALRRCWGEVDAFEGLGFTHFLAYLVLYSYEYKAENSRKWNYLVAQVMSYYSGMYCVVLYMTSTVGSLQLIIKLCNWIFLRCRVFWGIYSSQYTSSRILVHNSINGDNSLLLYHNPNLCSYPVSQLSGQAIVELFHIVLN